MIVAIHRRVPARRGFSFVEMLVVAGVIAVLFSLVFAGTTVVRNHSKAALARRMVIEIANALDAYRAEDPRHLFPTPRTRPPVAAGEWFKRDPADPATPLALLEKVGGWAAPAQDFDKDGNSPSFNCLLDPWRRPYNWLLDGAYVDPSTGKLVGTLMNGKLDKPTGSDFVATPPAPADWNAQKVEPFAYVWSVGIPRGTAAQDADPANAARWIYRKTSD